MQHQKKARLFYRLAILCFLGMTVYHLLRTGRLFVAGGWSFGDWVTVDLPIMLPALLFCAALLLPNRRRGLTVATIGSILCQLWTAPTYIGTALQLAGSVLFLILCRRLPPPAAALPVPSGADGEQNPYAAEADANAAQTDTQPHPAAAAGPSARKTLLYALPGILGLLSEAWFWGLLIFVLGGVSFDIDRLLPQIGTLLLLLPQLLLYQFAGPLGLLFTGLYLAASQPQNAS